MLKSVKCNEKRSTTITDCHQVENVGKTFSNKMIVLVYTLNDNLKMIRFHVV